MYVSIVGLKPKGIIGRTRFWTYTIPTSKDAQKTEGILHCEFNSRNGYHHTLTLWKSKEYMLGFLTSPPHLKAMKKYSIIGIGKVCDYKANAVPSWDEALKKWIKVI